MACSWKFYLFGELCSEAVDVDAAVRLLMFLHAVIVKPYVPRDGARMTGQLEHPARAFDGAAVDRPDLTVRQFGDETGTLCADAREARHLGVAAFVQVAGELVGKPPSERAARTGEDKGFHGDFFL